MADAKTRPLSPGQLQANLNAFEPLMIPVKKLANKDFENVDIETGALKPPANDFLSRRMTFLTWE